jgi:hypothetical protein
MRTTMSDPDEPLVIGDRVTRPLDVSEIRSTRLGTVIEVYAASPSVTSTEPLTLYAIEWDGVSYIERGYFRDGLTKVVDENT